MCSVCVPCGALPSGGGSLAGASPLYGFPAPSRPKETGRVPYLPSAPKIEKGIASMLKKMQCVAVF